MVVSQRTRIMMRTLQHEEMLLLRNVEIKKIIKNDFKRGSDCQFKPTDGVFHPYHLPEGEPAAAVREMEGKISASLKKLN